MSMDLPICLPGPEHVDYSGLEVRPSDDLGLQVAISNLPQIATGAEEKQVLPYYSHKKLPDTPPQQEAPIIRRRLYWILTTFFILAVLSIVVVVPVVKTAGKKEAHSPDPNVPHSTNGTAGPVNGTSVMGSGSPTPTSSSSTKDTFSGTGLSVIDPLNDLDRLVLFYQHFTGELHYAILSRDGNWQGGQSCGALNVMNATPITATSYVSENVISWEVFYMNTSGAIQNSYRSNVTSQWSPGSLTTQPIQVPKHQSTGFSVRYGMQMNSTTNSLDGGLRLYAGNLHGLVQEYIYFEGNRTWAPAYIFPQSDASAGCSITNAASAMPNLTTMHLVNTMGQLELWWEEYDTTANESASNFDDVWTKGTDCVSPLLQNTSLCANGLNAFYQTPDTHIERNEWSGLAGTQRWGESYDLSNATALPSTSIGCIYFGQPGPVAYYVFWQSNGSDIMMATVNWEITYQGFQLGNWSANLIDLG